jgi:IS30 family transposase
MDRPIGGKGRPRALRGVEDRFWAAVREGASVTDAGVAVHVARKTSYRWAQARGGVMPPVRKVSGRYLSVQEREEIAVGLAAGETQAVIARRLGRHPSTISQELKRNTPLPSSGRGGRYGRPYRALHAQARAELRARRPKPAKLATNVRLHDEVQAGLKKRWSPGQISRRLVVDFPAEEAMRVSHEAIYQSLYVQGRGALRRELAVCLRTGRTVRKHHRKGIDGRGKIAGMINIADRPAEAEDRAVSGHWEGDLIIGKNSASAIGTLVERTTRFVLLLHLPIDHTAESVRDAMITAMDQLPGHLWRSLTWDQGSEMSRHRQITTTTGLPIYFCDPHSPWQRGSNENTNGLLRQYFPKGTDLNVHTAEDLAAAAAELNGRPRHTLKYQTPAETLNKLLSEPFNPTGVATTG